MRVLSTEESRAFDRWAIEDLGVPSAVLMENAAIGVVEALVAHYAKTERIAIVCGPGGNGGDGLAVARHLAARGLVPRIVLAFFGRKPTGDTRLQLDLVRGLGLETIELTKPETSAFAGAEVIVDALFGTGLARPLAPPYDALVRALNALPAARVAVDLPSGLDASRGTVPGAAIRADLTITFAAPKVAHVLPPAADLCGEIAVADLGIPTDRLAELGPGLHLLSHDEAAMLVVPRPRGSHKGTFGHVLLFAGAADKPGAAILAARASVVGGAGLTTVALPASLALAVVAAVPEAMLLPLPERTEKDWPRRTERLLLEAAETKTAVAIGPGLGVAAPMSELVRKVAVAIDRPLVLDADGINAFAGKARALAKRSGATILTPHPGELARLLGMTTEAVEGDRRAAAERAARETGGIVVLKGDRSLVAAPEGDIWVNTTGNPAMASGGSGDVLTGLMAALFAQQLEPMAAALLAVHVHGLAGDLAKEELGGPAVPATDLVRALPRAFRKLATDSRP